MTESSDLSVLMDAAVQELQPSAPPLQDIIAHGRLTERRRRIAAGLAVGLVAALGAVVVGGRHASPAPAPAHRLPAGRTVQQLLTWADGLRRGRDAQVTYVVGGNTVVAGDHRIELPSGTRVEIEGTLPEGWFVLHGGTDDRGNWVGIRTGFLSMDGIFRPFHYEAPRSAHRGRGLVVSPDGSEVAYDGMVVDVATGRAVAKIPGTPLVLSSWTARGIEYADRTGGCCTPRLWSPGQPKAQTFPAYDAFVGPDLLLAYGKRCSTLSRLTADGPPTTVPRLCGEGVSDTSTSGAILTSTGKVIDPAGRQVADLRLPQPKPSMGIDFGDSCCGIRWESEGTILISMRKVVPGSKFVAATLLVRCTLRTGRATDCERASDDITDGTWMSFKPLPSGS